MFIPYFIQSRITTHPSQHLHLCHTQLIFVLLFARPILRTIKYSRFYSNAIEFTFKFERHFFVIYKTRCTPPF
ncbi:uncharacterized protein DS421_7g218730 [Arachis hypogaea]|nr:uncharacterized protein DS421_7g218730 [Arachis hypogaea]